MRSGRRIAVDVGKARVGVAMCDPEAILATPYDTLTRGHSDVTAVAALVNESVLEVIVGLPRLMDGSEGTAAKDARRWARALARKISPVPVRMVDERLSTVSAHAQLHEAGRAGRTHRSVVDQAAAVIILETALDTERQTGRAPGELLESTLQTSQHIRTEPSCASCAEHFTEERHS